MMIDTIPAVINTTLAGPPEFLHLGAEPVRWALLRELAQSDRRVDELVDALGKPQNLVSYHLGKLRAAQLVSARRSSHDRRDMFYRLDLPRCRELLSLAATSLHPALDVAPVAASGPPRAASLDASVLFLCTANTARSQMAEGLLRAATAGSATVASAGTQPSVVHPNAILAMERRGIDISGQSSKHMDAYLGTEFDLVVTVCDHVREQCPEFPGAARTIHWSIPDPVTEGADAGTQPAFERVAEDLAIRIEYLIPVLGRAQQEATR